jgi:hypothetical protein
VMNPFQTWNLPGEQDIDFLCDLVVYNDDMYMMYSIDVLVYKNEFISHINIKIKLTNNEIEKFLQLV